MFAEILGCFGVLQQRENFPRSIVFPIPVHDNLIDPEDCGSTGNLADFVCPEFGVC
jgi:hypothetical protein